MDTSCFRFACTASTVLLSTIATAQVTNRVSVATGGAQTDAPSYQPSLSASGRYVAFESSATNLGGSGVGLQIYVHDRDLGTTTEISVSTTGGGANDECLDPVISADGRNIAFRSAASNLVAGDTNGASDVFVRDTQTAATERVSVSTSGVEADMGAYSPSISSDGRYVAFQSAATNLVAGDTSTWADVFVRDRLLGTTERVSLATNGAQADYGGGQPSISGDGRFVAFASLSTNLALGDLNEFVDVFVHDRQTGTTECVSVMPNGGFSNGGDSLFASISADGRFVAFQSMAGNLSTTLASGSGNIYVRDRQSGTTELASVSSSGVPGNSHSDQPRISADGRYVAFSSHAGNLIPNDTNGGWDVFVRDLGSDTTARASVTSAGAQMTGVNSLDYRSIPVAISANGACIGLCTRVSNLISGDTNSAEDVFVHDRSAPPTGGFCYGDGASAPCPCGNAGWSGHGCGNSIFASGAKLAYTGNPSVSLDTVVLTASSMSGNASLYFQGTGTADLPFDDGKICVGGTLLRVGLKSVAGGTSSNPIDFDEPLSVKGAVPPTGGTRYYQTVYRNSQTFCTSATTNRSNGVAVTWLP